MAQGCGFSLSNDHFATDRAMLAFGQAGFSTGCFDGCIDNFGVSQSGSLVIAITISTNCTVVYSIAAVFTSRCNHSFGKTMLTVAYPFAITVNIFRSLRCQVRTICILQLCRSERNRGITRALNQLMGSSLCAGLGLYYAITGAVNIRAAGSGIYIASRGVHRAVYHDFSIHHIGVCTGVCSAGCIGYSFEGGVFTSCTKGKIAPLISIINVDIVATSKGTNRACFHYNLGAGQQRNVLINRNIRSGFYG